MIPSGSVDRRTAAAGRPQTAPKAEPQGFKASGKNRNPARPSAKRRPQKHRHDAPRHRQLSHARLWVRIIPVSCSFHAGTERRLGRVWHHQGDLQCLPLYGIARRLDDRQSGAEASTRRLEDTANIDPVIRSHLRPLKGRISRQTHTGVSQIAVSR